MVPAVKLEHRFQFDQNDSVTGVTHRHDASTLSQYGYVLRTDNRIGEFYVGFDAILQQVMPFIQMQMGAIDLGIDGPLPPLGMGVTANDGSIHGAMYVPMPLIKAGANGYMTFQMMQMMQQGGEENPPF